MEKLTETQVKRKTANEFIRTDRPVGYFEQMEEIVKDAEKADYKRWVLMFFVLNAAFLWVLFSTVVVFRIANSLF